MDRSPLLGGAALSEVTRMYWTRLFVGIPLIFCAVIAAWADPSAPDDSPSTEPSIHQTNLLGPEFISHVHGIEFRPPADSVEIDKASADTIVEFDRDDYNWQLKSWSVRLERSLPLTIHKDQFGRDQDGVMEVTLASIKQQTPSVEVVRNELINVGRIRVGMLAVRYETANHDRRFTQEAIFEAPEADHKLYYFFDLTGPGKPLFEPDDVINPAEKLAHDTFAEVVDSVVLLDRTNIVEYQRQGLYSTMGLFVLWNANHNQMIRAALVPEQYQRIIRDGRDIGYQHIVEEYELSPKSPEESTLRIGVRSHMMPTPLEQWDTETWMISSADRKHEHWETSARRMDGKGALVDSFSQVAASDEQTKAFAIDTPQDAANGSLMPSREGLQPNVDIATHRTLEVTTTHRRTQLSPFRMDVPVFYIPQAFSYLLPELLPLKPKTYMFATFVPSTPENSGVTSGGNVMSRYLEVLPAQHVKFHGQEFDAIPITDKVTLEGSVTTYYLSPEGKFLGSTANFTDGDKTTTIEVVPSDSQTLEHLWNRPDLSRPDEPMGGGNSGKTPSQP
ncbi:MAG TPA: hypothetical protein VHX86_19560 [Tepidisphaeraceae bacterium]|jgi:hypothetical protein|nr:hypothetical protein [Tepidisphaeraceae bacterium]